jgi:2-haloacid dehalogenase
MLDFSRYECITFDCYGTLVDWETGILAALAPILERHSVVATHEQILALYGELEPAEQRRAYRPYREILKGVVLGFGDKFGFRAALDELESLPNSVGTWKPFPDTVKALGGMKRRYKLAIISNIDDDLFAQTAKLLKTDFDQVITAQQARSYKPSHNNFLLAQQRMGVAKEKWLHAGESLYHDIAPCNELGIASVWVNRRGGKIGATRGAKAKPDLEVPDLKTLANLAIG